MYKHYNSGNVYSVIGNISQFVGNWVAQGYQSVEHFIADNRDLFDLS